MTIVGPQFWKELIESARRIRYYAVRSLVAGVVLTTLISLGQPLGVKGLPLADRRRAKSSAESVP